MTGLALLGIAGATWTMALRIDADFPGDEPVIQAGLLDWIILSYVFSGLVAWWRRPDSRLGPLMVAGGFLVSLSALSSASGALPATIGQALDLVPFAVFLHVYLAFPSGRLTRPVDRGLVAAAYVVAVGVQLVVLMLGGFRPDNVLAIVDEADLAFDIFKVQLIVLAGLLLLGIAALVSKRRAEGWSTRRASSLLFDSFVIALAMSALLGIAGSVSPEWTWFQEIQRTTFFFLGLAPIAFLIALLDARLARSAVGALVVELQADPTPQDLREPLARALHDPSLEIAYWLPEFGGWADSEGRTVTLPTDTDSRATTLIERDSHNVAVLIHSPALEQEQELLDGVSAAAGIALENARLHAELRAKLEELDGSRARVIEAGQSERKRLERNLHDGAQQRLVALSLDLRMLSGKLADDPEAQRQIDVAREEIAVSLDELRDIARGLHPAVLSSHGLPAALKSLVAKSPVRVTLEVEVTERLAEPVEVAAYYVVSESLANVAKHAAATSVTVRALRRGDEMLVEVVDNGAGGADSESGSGLQGLTDRVEALGGRLVVATAPEGGTSVTAQMPWKESGQ